MKAMHKLPKRVVHKGRNEESKALGSQTTLHLVSRPTPGFENLFEAQDTPFGSLKVRTLESSQACTETD